MQMAEDSERPCGKRRRWPWYEVALCITLLVFLCMVAIWFHSHSYPTYWEAASPTSVTALRSEAGTLTIGFASHHLRRAQADALHDPTFFWDWYLRLRYWHLTVLSLFPVALTVAINRGGNRIRVPV